MIKLEDKKNCCGCTACVQRCPKRCISLKEDFISIAKSELLPDEMQGDFIKLIEERCNRLQA